MHAAKTIRLAMLGGFICLWSGGSALAADPAAPIELTLDARDLRHRVMSATETIPLSGKSGDMALFYSAWIPGDHAPDGPIDRLAGLAVSADGAALSWRRDADDVFKFHVTVPQGAQRLTLRFRYLAPSADAIGSAIMTRDIVAVKWPYALLYPAGSAAAAITIHPRLLLPSGFSWATALVPESQAEGSLSFAPVSLEKLVDSPIYGGSLTRRIVLDPDPDHPVGMTLFGDTPERIAPDEEQIAAHRALIRQADALFGSRPFSHYDFLVTLSAPFGVNGLEHRQSSEVFLHPDYFADWQNAWDSRYILAHEYVHAWNGKWRVPAGLQAADFNTPLHPDLLWVYEGLTQYWAKVLTARAGIWSARQARDDWAVMAARYSREAAKDWRPLGDSTRDAIINPRERTEWHSLQRAEDYYDEGALLWLDADTLIRETSRGKRSLEDFARQFFAGGQEAPSPKPYDLAELIQALRLVAPIDWAGFFAARIDQTGHWDPAAGLRRGGYDLVFNNEPGPSCTADDARRGLACFTASIGLTLAADGTVDSVEWDGPAFRAGIAPATKLVAVDGRGFTLGRLTAAILGAQGSAEPIELLVQDQDRLDRVVLPWHGGLQIPHLVRSARGPASLDAILRPLPAQK